MLGVSKAASRRMLVGSVGVLGLSLASGAFGAITVDGTLAGGEPDFGTAIATQSDYTQFGKSTDATGGSAGGSELDAAYGKVENGNLYILLTGNIEGGSNPNHFNVYIADGRTGQTTLSAGGISNSTGSKFSSNFGNGATFALDTNDFNGTVYTDAFDLVGNTTAYLGSSTPTGGSYVTSGQTNTIYNGIGIALNNTNVLGQPAVNALGGAVTPAQAETAVTGFEFSIPLSTLGNPTGPIDVLALINGSGNGYLSNQLLPGLSAGTGNLGGTTFDFSGTSGGFFQVANSVPEPASLGLLGVVSLAALRRRSK